MNRRAFLKFLGIGVPAAAVVAAVVAVVAPKLGTLALKTVSAKLGEWNNYHSEGDPELMEAIENRHSYSEVYPDLKTTFTLPEQSGIYFDKEFMQSLRNQEALDRMAARGESMPIAAHVRREFFRYDA